VANGKLLTSYSTILGDFSRGNYLGKIFPRNVRGNCLEVLFAKKRNFPVVYFFTGEIFGGISEKIVQVKMSHFCVVGWIYGG